MDAWSVRRRRAAVVLVGGGDRGAACSAERRAPVAVPPARRRRRRHRRRRRPPRTDRAAHDARPDTTDHDADSIARRTPASNRSRPPAPRPHGVTDRPRRRRSPTRGPCSTGNSPSRLIGRGDYAVGVAVAVNGTIVHPADFGYRVAPLRSEPHRAPPPVADRCRAARRRQRAGHASRRRRPRPPVDYGGRAATIGVDDRFRIASICKVITAIVVLQLVEAGQLGLDDPSAVGSPSSSAPTSAIRGWTPSPCASCCRTRPGSRRTRARSSAAASGRAGSSRPYGLSHGR